MSIQTLNNEYSTENSLALDSSRQYRILVVDDDPDHRHYLRAILKRGDYEVLTASHVEEALFILKTRPIDLMVIDVLMAGMDESDLLKIVRNIPELSEMPIIGISGAGKEVEERTLANGADLFCDKRMAYRSLLGQVSQLLSTTR